MHAPVLMLVTAFAASVAAAPLPITPIESPVEGLAVRDAEAALSQAQMDVLKRSIFERLEEIVPVKRDEVNGKLPSHGLNDRDLNVRQGDLSQVEGSVDVKRSTTHGGNDKRKDPVWSASSEEKREALPKDPVWSASSEEKREALPKDPVWSASSEEKREALPKDPVWSGSAEEKREALPKDPVWSGSAEEKREALPKDPVWSGSAEEKREALPKDPVWSGSAEE